MIVVSCGSFDGDIHPGHINFLKVAKNCGLVLFVCLVTDAIIKKNKHREPVYQLQQRIANLNAIDEAIRIMALSDNEEQNLDRVLSLMPDIYCFGSDQTTWWDKALKMRLEAIGTSIKVIPRYLPEIYSTTHQLAQRSKDNWSSH
ncbi:MAG: adenylyltransferase/cytidyltransferase family protein [Ktedonobacteraceae bacterium]